MNKRLLKKLRMVTIICLVVLVIELMYILFCAFVKEDKSIYFDGINAFDVTEGGYVAVGSNNNNDKYYEKAKLTVYNKRKENVLEKLYNKGYNSAFFDVTVDGDSYIVVGNCESDKKDNNNSTRDALIVKYDKDGNVIFDNTFSVLDNSKFTSVVVVKDGYLVVGQSIYKSDKVGDSKEGGAYLIKYSKEGKLLWKVNYGNNNSAIFNDLLVHGDYIYVVGKNNSRVGLICKYDEDGTLIDFNDYKYTDALGFSGIVELDDYLYVCGSNRTDDDDTDAMIVKYDLNTKYIDQVMYDSEGMERFNKIIKDKHDNLITIGINAMVDEKSHNTVDEYDYDGIIAKYDKELDKIAVVNYGDERDDYFTDLKLDENNYLVSGYSSYEDGSYMSKFIKYSDALKVLEI